jgi:adenylate cyclase
MVTAQAQGRLSMLLADRHLFDLGSSLLLAEIADRCGIEESLLTRIRLAQGLPTGGADRVPAFVAEDVTAFRAGLELFGELPTLAFTRVMGSAVARIAEAAVSLFLAEVEPGLTDPGTIELDVALANEAAVASLNSLPGVLEHLLREHMAAAVRRQRSTQRAEDAQTQVLAVGFVDLVDSTSWARGLSLREHAVGLSRFENLAWDLANGHGGRVVKLIGDEAMFVCPSPSSAASVAVQLCQAVDAEPTLPPARGAVGYGSVLVRGGDYFGPLVNLAARCVKLPSPGGVVLTAEAWAQRSGEPPAGWIARHLETQRIRGFDKDISGLVELRAEHGR